MTPELLDASAWVIPVILAITLHEAAHGWMAFQFGDDTAKSRGRVTFNPLKHIDRVGTILVPALLFMSHSPIMFGYAKPVPVDFRRLNPPRRGMFMVAVAGPLSNVIQALVAALILRFANPPEESWFFLNLARALMINCALVALNLIPILPLDGGRMVDSMLSGPVKRAYGVLDKPFGPIRLPAGIVILFVSLLAAQQLGYDLSQTLIGQPAMWLLNIILKVTGNGGQFEYN